MTGATGYISYTRVNGTLQWEWAGGDVVWISWGLLASMGILRPSSDTLFSIGPYTLRCTEHRIKEQVIEAMRVDESGE